MIRNQSLNVFLSRCGYQSMSLNGTKLLQSYSVSLMSRGADTADKWGRSNKVQYMSRKMLF